MIIESWMGVSLKLYSISKHDSWDNRLENSTGLSSFNKDSLIELRIYPLWSCFFKIMDFPLFTADWHPTLVYSTEFFQYY